LIKRKHQTGIHPTRLILKSKKNWGYMFMPYEIHAIGKFFTLAKQAAMAKETLVLWIILQKLEKRSRILHPYDLPRFSE